MSDKRAASRETLSRAQRKQMHSRLICRGRNVNGRERQQIKRNQEQKNRNRFFRSSRSFFAASEAKFEHRNKRARLKSRLHTNQSRFGFGRASGVRFRREKFKSISRARPQQHSRLCASSGCYTNNITAAAASTARRRQRRRRRRQSTDTDTDAASRSSAGTQSTPPSAERMSGACTHNARRSHSHSGARGPTASHARGTRSITFLNRFHNVV